LIARCCPDPAIKLFKFGVVTVVGDPTTTCDVTPCGAVICEETSFEKIAMDFRVHFEFANSTAFCPADFAMFKAVSTTFFLLMNFDKKSLSFEKIPEQPT